MAKQREVLEIDRTGVFTMDVVSKILNCDILDSAKNEAIIWFNGIDTSDIKPENARKIKQMIDKSKTIHSLALSISNFILAFQGLSVIK